MPVVKPFDLPTIIWKQKAYFAIVHLFLAGIFFSSFGYSWSRFDHRFFAFRYVKNKVTGKPTDSLIPLSDGASRPLAIPRAKGIVVTEEQARELASIGRLVEKYVGRDDVLFTYPEYGIYNFLFDRKFLGRFPIATFSWFDENWHKGFVEEILTTRPRYVILQKDVGQYWKDVYLAKKANRRKFEEVYGLIVSRYTRIDETREAYLYKLK